MAKAALVRLSARRLASDGVGFYPASFVVEVSRVVIQQADQPDLVVDLSGPAVWPAMAAVAVLRRCGRVSFGVVLS